MEIMFFLKKKSNLKSEALDSGQCWRIYDFFFFFLMDLFYMINHLHHNQNFLLNQTQFFITVAVSMWMSGTRRKMRTIPWEDGTHIKYVSHLSSINFIHLEKEYIYVSILSRY